jgi:hypothetical protein
MIDLRLPSGWFFAITGVILLGLFSPERPELTSVRVHLYGGTALPAFGPAMLDLARRVA